MREPVRLPSSLLHGVPLTSFCPRLSKFIIKITDPLTNIDFYFPKSGALDFVVNPTPDPSEAACVEFNYANAIGTTLFVESRTVNSSLHLYFQQDQGWENWEPGDPGNYGELWYDPAVRSPSYFLKEGDSDGLYLLRATITTLATLRLMYGSPTT